MLLPVLDEVAEVAAIVAIVYAALAFHARRRQPAWSARLAERRLLVILVLALVATAVKVAEQVLGQPPGPLDQAILLALHRQVPPAGVAFFQAVTNCGSSKVLLPLVSVVALVLARAGHRREAWLLAASGYAAAGLMATLKTMIGRERPALWATDAYWGSSFPSGHTLTSAAVSLAAAICIGRLRPRQRRPALAVALVWLALMGLSRMVLGVHWPSDVLAAACIGILLTLAIDSALALHARRAAATGVQPGSGGERAG